MYTYNFFNLRPESERLMDSRKCIFIRTVVNSRKQACFLLCYGKECERNVRKTNFDKLMDERKILLI